MISADVKADVKQQEIKEQVAVSCNILYKCLQNLKYVSFSYFCDVFYPSWDFSLRTGQGLTDWV